MATLRQEINQRQEHVDSLLNMISCEVNSRFQERENQFQCIKQAIDLEIVKIEKAISNLEERITAGVASNNGQQYNKLLWLGRVL